MRQIRNELGTLVTSGHAKAGFRWPSFSICIQDASSIGWSVSNRMKRDLAIRALNMAIALRQPPKGCIHNSDRGSQYSSHDYQKILRQDGFKLSMSGKGNCYDNSAVETFFNTIKAELIWRRSWRTRRDAGLAVCA